MQIITRTKQLAGDPDISIIVASKAFPNENIMRFLDSTRKLTAKHEAIILTWNIRKDVDFEESAMSLLDSSPNLIKVTFVLFTFDRGHSCMKNVGAVLARSNNLLLADDDVEVREDATPLLEYLRRGDCHGVQPLILRLNNMEIVDSAGDFITKGWFGLYDPHSRAAGSHVSSSLGPSLHLEEVPSLRGAFMIVRKDAFAAVGGYDETLVFNYEDVDLGWRLVSAGFRLLFVPAVKVLHKGGRTTRPSGSDEDYFRLCLLNLHAIQFKMMNPAAWPWVFARFFTFIYLYEIAGMLKRNTGVVTATSDIFRANRQFVERFRQSLLYRRLLAETFHFSGRKKLEYMSRGKRFILNQA